MFVRRLGLFLLIRLALEVATLNESTQWWEGEKLGREGEEKRLREEKEQTGARGMENVPSAHARGAPSGVCCRPIKRLCFLDVTKR